MFSSDYWDDWGEEDQDNAGSKKSHHLATMSKKLKSGLDKKLDQALHSPGMTEGLLASAGKNSKSSKSSGSLLRKGIKFANFDEFCQFVDKGKNKKKRKANHDDQEGATKDDVQENPSHQHPKKAKFDLDKIKSVFQKKEKQDENITNQGSSSSVAEKNLKSSRFRYLNEMLYTQSGSQSFKMFKGDNKAFHCYHEGFQEQAKKWPNDPTQRIIAAIMKKSEKNPVIADFGCGEAKIAQAFPTLKVHSFDFVAINNLVTPCDMSKTPLTDESVDIAVFCLSLMGTNLRDYLKEANRVLKLGGTLKIAEVESRFQNLSVEEFIAKVQKFGFKLKWKDENEKYFVFMDFKKVEKTKKKVPELQLKPCFYKKR